MDSRVRDETRLMDCERREADTHLACGLGPRPGVGVWVSRLAGRLKHGRVVILLGHARHVGKDTLHGRAQGGMMGLWLAPGMTLSSFHASMAHWPPCQVVL
jgi:hypothetical protein